jgi:hypothetical protein
MLSLWQYLRRRTRDAVLAGFQDALQAIESGDPVEAYLAPVGQLERSLSDLGQKKIATPGQIPAAPPTTPARAANSPSPAAPIAPAGNSYDARLAPPASSPTLPLPGLDRQPTPPPRRGRPRNDLP